MSAFLLLILAFVFANCAARQGGVANNQVYLLNLDSPQTSRNNFEVIRLQGELMMYMLLLIQHVHTHMVCLDSYNSAPSASSKVGGLQCALTFQKTFLDVTRTQGISDWRKRNLTILQSSMGTSCHSQIARIIRLFAFEDT